MTRARRLTEPLIAYRFGDPTDRYPIYSAQRALEFPGRWHDAGDAVIYASEHCAMAMLEKLVHLHDIPSEQFFIKITIPPGIEVEVADAKKLKGWDAPDGGAARRFGHAWHAEQRSAVLIVPSVILLAERNVVINAAHSDFRRIKHGREERVKWDERLFGEYRARK